MLEAIKKKSAKITDIRKNSESIFLDSERGIIRIMPISDNIVRISFSENGEFSKEQGKDIAGPKENVSFSIDDSCMNDCSDDSTDDWSDDCPGEKEYIFVELKELSIKVNRYTGSISYYKKNGELLLAEKAGGTAQCYASKTVEAYESYRYIEDENAVVENVKTADGVKQVIKAVNGIFDKILYRTRVYLDFDEDEVIYGLGQSPEGIWNLRGTTQYLYQANLKSPIPIMLSSKGYGLVFSTKSTMIFDDSNYGTYVATHGDLYLDYYFVAGDGRSVVKAMRYLYGKASILPKWACGYIQSKERFESQKEILDAADKFKSLEFPVSAMILDWLSWPEGLWGEKRFDTSRFPNAKEMTDRLHDMGIHFMMSVWPNMGEGGNDFKEFKEEGLFLPNSHTYNALSEKGRALYWKQLNENLFSKGVDGWWGDNCEPIDCQWEHRYLAAPAVAYAEYVNASSKLLPEDELNAYCLYHAKTIYEGQRNTSTDKRVINLARSGMPGSQKYGAIVWSGDISAGWDTLKNQIVAGLSFVSTGMPYWNLDIGGFFVKPGETWYWNGEYEDPLNDEDYLELYDRWFQYAAFLPFMRAHGTDIEREPWNIAPVGSKLYTDLLNTVKLRESLRPYIYSLFGLAYLYDESIIRPLIYDYPEDEETKNIDHEFMFGPNLLVCPVYESNKVTGGKIKVYLPKGGAWYEFHTHQKYAGGEYHEIILDSSYIPVFVPEGSIIPVVKEENGLKVSGIIVFGGKDGKFSVYDDAGDGYGYEKGEYCLTEFSYDDSTRSISRSSCGINKYTYEEQFVEII